MCGICGYVNLKENIDNDIVIEDMTNVLKKRGPNDKNTYICGNVALGHTRLSIIDVVAGVQPMKKSISTSNNLNADDYVIVYNGELYNTDNLRNDLIKKGYSFDSKCDTEVVITSYIEYGNRCVDYLNGIFAFAIYDTKENLMYFARDRLGIKPLFYTIFKNENEDENNKENENKVSKNNDNINEFIFASEIKGILKHPDVDSILDKEGLLELFALGPAHTPGKTYFKDILEIKAGHYGIFKNGNFSTTKYWDLGTKECLDTEEIAIKKIHDLLTDATKRQLVSDVGICSMLSGGVDSSVITKIANDNIDNLTTFSINYLDNDKDFTPNDYQMTKDSDYVKIMVEALHTEHKDIVISNEDLFYLLKESMIARDMPGMADIDSSMFAFCNEINKHNFKVSLSGECSDEIFCGYPWFYKEHLMNYDGFPWALSQNLRENIINKNIFKEGKLTEYIRLSKEDTLKNVTHLDKNVTHLDKNDTFENSVRDINYLTIKWFMNTLLERTDRMSMANSLEVRVPFADHRIFEYVYNLPAKMKLGLNHFDKPVEKYLLRKAFETEILDDVLYRKKSPFPKTYDPKYLKLVEDKLQDILNNKNSKLLELINVDFVQNLIDTHGENLTENWFGQLMTYPQTLAYLIQIDMWLEEYDIKILL
jgi:asparagine synthase (glutamine-hydrolysing)